jgi:hypothetical protein
LWGACRWYFQTRALALGAISEPAVAKSITPAGAQLNHFLLRKKSGFEQGVPDSTASKRTLKRGQMFHKQDTPPPHTNRA